MKSTFLACLIIAPLIACTQTNRHSGATTADTTAFATGSNVTFPSISKQQIENLTVLGKVWGFLKYYHPDVAKGQFNWDYELFRFLPSYLKCKNIKQRNEALLDLVNKIGMPDQCRKCSDEELKNAIYKPDLKWIENAVLLGDTLSNQLVYIKNNRHQGESYYISKVRGVGNPAIKNEHSYAQFIYPDAGYRLLALYRYWNMIEYWFPNKHLIGEDWNNVLTEFIPKMINCKNAAEYLITCRRMIARVHDTHANIWGKNAIRDSLIGEYIPPVICTFVDNQAVISKIWNEKLAQQSNIRVGDIITSIDNKSIDQIIKDKTPDLPASNYPTQLRDLSRILLIGRDSVSNISLIRDGKKLDTKIFRTNQPKGIKNLYRSEFSYQNDSSFFFIEDGIGYINLGKIKTSQLKNVFDALQHAKGLIIDNRQYPGEFIIYDLSAKLLPQKMAFAKFPVGSLTYPGVFTTTPPIYVGRKNPDYFKGQVVILINEQTQSSGEFHTMAFRTAPNATVIGSTTAGADGNVSGFYLPGNIYTMFSGIGVHYPDGTETQRVGIVPDIEVKRTINGIKNGKDELVEKAIEMINK